MDIDAFILVGGRSSRFGSDKAKAYFDGRPLLERTVETVRRALKPKRIILVAANHSQILGSANATLSLPIVFDIYKERGPAGGVHAALSSARTEWAFTIACDYPFISADVIGRLVVKISADVDSIVPGQPDGRLQPLVAFYRVNSVLRVLENALLIGESCPPLGIIFDKVNSVTMPFEEIQDLRHARDIFLNMNTLADLKRASQINRRSPRI